MTAFFGSITGALGVMPGDCIALIGGGGKTTVMSVIQRELHERRRAVVATTTTKISRPDTGQLVLAESCDDLNAAIRDAWSTGGLVTAGQSLLGTEKVIGLAPERLCTLKGTLPEAIIVCEADGSKGRPLKVHAAHEPVVPACTDLLVIIGGLRALGHPVSSEVIHRVDLFDCSSRGGDVTPELFADLLLLAAHVAPRIRRTVFLLNGLDAAPASAAREVAARLRATGSQVVVTKWGRPVDLNTPVSARG
jgi:probable selenium-dependent hydroxylase accessory protein YqeC